MSLQDRAEPGDHTVAANDQQSEGNECLRLPGLTESRVIELLRKINVLEEHVRTLSASNSVYADRLAKAEAELASLRSRSALVNAVLRPVTEAALRVALHELTEALAEILKNYFP